MNDQAKPAKLSEQLTELLTRCTPGLWQADKAGSDGEIGHAAGITSPDEKPKRRKRRIAYFGSSRPSRKSSEEAKKLQEAHFSNALLACLMRNQAEKIIEALEASGN